MYNKSIFILSFFSVLFLRLQAQTASVDSVRSDIVQDHRIKNIVEREIEFNKKNEGKIPGYRIQIHFGSERDKAKDIKSQFLSKYPGVLAFEEYEQPHFKIRVGNFSTKLEAYKFMKEISLDFPNAFIVQDDIELK